MFNCKIFTVPLLCYFLLNLTACQRDTKIDMNDPDPLHLKETSFKEKVLEDLYLSIQNWSSFGSFKGEKNLNIHYRIYGQAQPNSKPLVIVPGYTESSLKYIELAYDLIQNSFSPIYVIDHRNQGASDHILKDKQKGYVENFLFYSKDLKKFIDTVVKINNPDKKLYLFSHSMGGLISLLYLLDNPTQIESAVLSSPLLRINLSKFLQNLSIFLSFLTPQIIIDTRVSDSTFDPKNPLTHNPTRYKFNKFIEFTNGYYIKGTTLNWVKEASQKSKFIREQANKISTPLLILKASEDTLVDNKIMEPFCKKAKNCSLIEINKAKHEIFMEKDEVRNQAFQNVIEFFNNTK